MHAQMHTVAPAQTDLPLVVFSTLSAREALKELIPRFEQELRRPLAVTYAGGSVLSRQLVSGSQGDLFIGPGSFTRQLIDKGVLCATGEQLLARSATALAMVEGVPKPALRTAQDVVQLLLSARSVTYSPGASGLHFVELLKRYGIADRISGKTVMAQAGELVGDIVARGAAEVGLQQISELLPVGGIQVLPLPVEFQQTIDYGATPFTAALRTEAAQLFVTYLRSEAAKGVWRRHGLEPL
ncbi:MAG TPA: substrate-binding domain-containing protein [Ramlibacter sp.]|nr:substrate-binding domain-containing protein [Ramlibacter sp.]